ncbi:MAG: chemotaxis protein CheA [Sulfuritalea sp.]|jgi:two-component system chemotaxis sensor kinase CheA|nr:chemotaxis protein CheA [Sulfuritalea sp.]
MDTNDELAEALGVFMEEARELLAQMEEILLREEAGGGSEEDLPALFRCAHTIKGSAGMFGFDEVVRFTHVVENVLDRLRNGAIGFSRQLVGVLLDCQDHIAGLVSTIAEGGTPDIARSDELIAELRAWTAADDAAGAAAPRQLPAESAVRVAASGGGGTGSDYWHLSLRFAPGILAEGMDPMCFINYLGTCGRIVHVETITDHLPTLDEADPELCHIGFEVALDSPAGKEEIERVFQFVAENSHIVILPPHSKATEFIGLIESLDEDSARLGEILVACGTLTPQELDTALRAQQQSRQDTPPRLGAILVDSGMVAPAVVGAAIEKQQRNEEKRRSETKSLKVPSERLDALIDRVGELVIAGAGTHAQAVKIQRRDLQESASLLLSLVEDIRDMALRLRMVAIGEVFSRFPRVVRDVSRELGKDIELRISGAEAELDKSMVEKVGDPLMHLIRNSMDHGIEAAEVRAASGKPVRGTVALNACHESGAIIIEVADDGGGLDADRILKKAIEKGIVAEGANLSTQEIYQLILAPGFSTAETVTNLSGRGVGMDVVKNNVEALRGTLDIDSVPGQGTTIRLCLPLTLAIIDGFHVGVGSTHFIVPLDMVVECVELPTGLDHFDYMEQRGEALPFVRLRQLFGEHGPAHIRPRVVIVRFAGKRAGLVVDRIYGKCQTVIKPLGPLFEQVPCVSGSTILGDGEVALIIDVAQLIQGVVTRNWQATHGGTARGATALAA